MTGSDLDGAVQAFADRIRHPVIIFDTELAVAAFSVHQGRVDRARLNMILTHRVSDRAAHMITEHHVDRAAGAVLLPVVAGIPERIIAPLRYQGRLTGYVSYVPGDDHDFALRDADDIVTARDELGALLAAREEERRRGVDRVGQLVARLLDGEPDEREAAELAFLQDALIAPAPQYSVVAFRGTASLDLTDLAALRPPAAVAVVIDGEGVLVVPGEVDATHLTQQLAGSRHTGIRAGIGGPRTRLAELRGSRREARLALRATAYDPDRYGVLGQWSELGLDRALLQLPLERMTADDLPPAVARLISFGSGPDLAATLESYLDNGADAQATAQRLHIHRSTLYYRLDRVRAVIESDLGDGETRRELHTGLRIAALAGLR